MNNRKYVLNALEKVYFSIESIMIFCWNAFNNGFWDFACLDLGSGNDYSEHLAFQVDSVVPISVSIDITLLTKFSVDDGAGAALFYQNSFSWDDDELKFDFFMASDDVDGRDFFGGYPFESGVKNRSRGSNCKGGTKD